MEQTVVQRFVYPAFLSSPPSLAFTDQFAFRHLGSPSAGIIFLLNTVTHLLLINPYISVVPLDFSKASDTLRLTTAGEKLNELDLLDQVYNWLTDFFTRHFHCTAYCGQLSMMKTITANIIKGSAIGPAAYVVTASDLNAMTRSNQLCKFDADTCLIIPANNDEGNRNHLLHGSASNVVRMGRSVSGNRPNLTLYRSETPRPIKTKLNTIHYVRG
jgi:hypothetical protein